MVSKVVADFISPGAISEQMILLNGIPYIELESSPMGMQVSEIMTKNLSVIPATGMTTSQIYDLLNSNNFTMFPVVNNSSDMIIKGLASRKIIVMLLKTSISATKNIADRQRANTAESSSYQENSASNLEIWNGDYLMLQNEIESSIEGSQLDLDDEIDSLKDINSNQVPETRVAFIKKHEVSNNLMLDFSRAVDNTPIILDINASTETAEEIFNRMGPRSILVQDLKGRLVGLLTRKDFIRSKLLHSNH
ncbi:hypothetical protein BB560_004997 [Smittium megazygosporum]|uniref:CBS domain-containing protein n=1 Tax=Smittium megazygosporum TaxID=133381 RepID=A0A2T9Z7P3_9FUNG|nr:hypothetical protein BB560_004997 [Smittium megazygosporum]